MQEFAPNLRYNSGMATRRVAEVKLLKDLQKGPPGGYREGGGRPANADLYEKPLRKAHNKIAHALPQIVDALIDLALGAHVEEVGEDGRIRRYQRPPDREAIRYAIDRLGGRPTERKEVSKEINKTETVQIFLPDNNRRLASPDEVIDAEFSESGEEAPSRRSLPHGRG